MDDHGNDEIRNFIKVWIKAVACICYCYYISARIPKGIMRFISLFPIFYLFTILPLDLHSFHLGAPTTFFLVWLGNFKLILFSLDEGPLYPPPPNLFHFISIASLPIKIKQKQNPSHQTTQKSNRPILFTIKALILAIVIQMYEYRPYLHPVITFSLYCLNMYLGLEIVLALVAIPVRAIFGFELEPQFNEPYLSTSLQDFWGRRWNLMVTGILRPTVYFPVRRMFTVTVVGPRWAWLPGLLAVFLVSGLMHEVVYYYFTRANPTWEVTWFFVLQGMCTAAEIVVKKAVVDHRWRLHRLVSGALTLGFLAVTGDWLFFPQLLRNGVHEKGIKEYALLFDFVKANLPPTYIHLSPQKSKLI
ncbi:probable long-chain-alcohol O-fatty-acyltransferase 5 [Ziziphus jujuba]|uniref:Wax synthase domain-containing protein n=2 Tax=Ziziphus jujuba TaxID=326968 RepID=A0A978W4C3_ZIZJJ|nr:probable long-chain-alcohol O-fatty-acyltransferase 5 [Ziziphus jujuba]KAH7546807.1 hypothetical protein FEM48_Zijuj01G0240300 [Ziziphus jujuba var. spinosa]